MHTKGPWTWGDHYRGLYGSGKNNEVLDHEPYKGMWLAGDTEANARLIAAACTSYDKHCGERAVECAEADLLGQALEALEAARIELENEGAWVPTKVTAVLALAKGEK